MGAWFEVWQEVAEREGGQVAFGGPTFGASLVTTIEGVQLFASAPMSGEGGMRVVAPAPGAETLELNVRHGYVYPLGRALGVQDVIVGDPVFDDRFIVRCNDDELARAWLDDAARAAVSAASDAYAYSVTEARVAVTRSGVSLEDDVDSFAAVLLATARLAQAGQRQLGRWQRAAEQLGGRVTTTKGRWGVDGEILLELTHPAARIEIDTPFAGLGGRGRRALWTRARSPRRGEVRDRWALHAREHALQPTPPLAEGQPVSDAGFAQRWRCLADDPARLALRLSPARRVLLKDLAPAAVQGEPDEVSAWLPGFVVEPGRLSRLADLVAELALDAEAPSSGPYR